VQIALGLTQRHLQAIARAGEIEHLALQPGHALIETYKFGSPIIR
jgi:hypothetical protein